MTHKRRRGISASQKKEIWERWQRGQSSNDIGRALGKPRGSIYFLLSSTGGIEPPPRRRSRLALSLSEREEISRGLAEGQSMREIASSIRRAPSTVSREIGRHHGRERYRAAEADQRAWDSARRPKPCRLAVQPTTAEDCGQEAEPRLVAGADLRVAEAAIPGRAGDADLPRNHLPKPLRSGPRCAQEGARRASENAASDPAVQAGPYSRSGARPDRRCRLHPRAPCRGRGSRGSWPLGGGPPRRVHATHTSRRWSSASLGSRCW